ncbi:uncharacterized protein PAC_15852 [Phialocephala subalpina]|uniref:NACHT domain-containing protein n=1 Tax=Phialocephala subalpina TaxID=576137 RepID=A0A1L7XLN6_9HELO|nr:uncharacterized protein PAC_15852 [Phialocephala subalpina]
MQQESYNRILSNNSFGSNVRIHQGDVYMSGSDVGADERCFRDLLLTDPRDDKTRIETEKGGLFRDSYRWILDHSSFINWRDTNESRLLWIKGGPGKGKTMLLIGIIKELSQQMDSTPDSGVLSYVFCQGTDAKLNTATAVLRGLIYCLAAQRPFLISHLRERYDLPGPQLFEGANAFFALKAVFTNMLRDSRLPRTFLIIDALDECDTGLLDVLDFIVQNAAISSPRVKWLVSSHHRHDIEERLARSSSQMKLILELNAPQVSNAVNAYIDHKVSRLPWLREDNRELRDVITNYLQTHAHETFLWVALVYDMQSLQNLVELCGSFLIIREGIIHFIHQSAKDYLRDNAEHEIFPNGRAEVHWEIASQSLKVMSVTLQRDIYGLQHPGTSIDQFTSPNPDLLTRIEYACVYWIGHSCELDSSSHNWVSLHSGGKIYEFLQKHLLHWLEALSILGKLSEGVQNMKLLQSKIDPSKDAELLALVRDANRFILSNRYIIENAPLQIYSSALIFSPKESRVRNLFWELVPRWIKTPSAVPGRWGPLLQCLEGHSESVLAVEFSRDGRLLASSDGNTVRLWDAHSGELLDMLDSGSGKLMAVAFSPNSWFLAVGSANKKVLFWDISRREWHSTLEACSDSAHRITLSQDGNLSASGPSDDSANSHGASNIFNVQVFMNLVNAVAFSLDSRFLAFSVYGETVEVFDLFREARYDTLKGHPRRVTAVAFSPDSQLLASASDDTTIIIWDVNKKERRRPSLNNTGPVSAVVYSPDGRLLASVSSHHPLRLWDVSTGALLQTLGRDHSDEAEAVAFSPDGQLLATAQNDVIELWDTSPRGLLWDLIPRWIKGAFVGLEFRSQPLKCFKDTGNITTLAFSPDKERDRSLLASGSRDGIARLWDSSTEAPHSTLKEYPRPVTAAALSPDGRLLSVSSAGAGKRVKFWDTETGEFRSTLECDTETARALKFSPDGQLLAVLSIQYGITYWDVPTRMLPNTTKSSWSEPPLVFSPDGQFLAILTGFSIVKLCNVRERAVLGYLEGHTHRVQAATFSPDSRLLATASIDKTIRLWELSTRTPCCTLIGHSSRVDAVIFSPDGQLLASASGDKTIRLWDVETRRTIEIFDTREEVKILFSFSSDGRYLITDQGFLHLNHIHPSQTQLPSDSSFFSVVKESWVAWNTELILWLPPDYRPSHLALGGNVLAITHKSGPLFYIEFDPSYIEWETSETPRP